MQGSTTARRGRRISIQVNRSSANNVRLPMAETPSIVSLPIFSKTPAGLVVTSVVGIESFLPSPPGEGSGVREDAANHPLTPSPSPGGMRWAAAETYPIFEVGSRSDH